tara:strand:- start:1424 stop:1711 length:288 start_codon:yes stop_codon:yes gene_type:complete
MIDLNEMQELLKLGTLVSVATWGVTEACKPLVKMATKAWSRTAVRVFALACGGCFGYFLKETPEGLVAGICGAALSATVVACIKAKIKSSSASDE